MADTEYQQPEVEHQDNEDTIEDEENLTQEIEDSKEIDKLKEVKYGF